MIPSWGRIISKKDVFVKQDIQYLIFDNLRILQNSSRNIIKQLGQHGYKDLTNLIEISQKVGSNQVIALTFHLFHLPLISTLDKKNHYTMTLTCVFSPHVYVLD